MRDEYKWVFYALGIAAIIGAVVLRVLELIQQRPEMMQYFTR